MPTKCQERRTTLEKRVQALRKIQLEIAKLQGQYFYDVLVLEDEYDTRLSPYYNKRLEITCGEHEPDDTEADCPLTYADIPYTGNEGEVPTRGIPGFWLIVFNNVPLIWGMIQRYDLKPLTHLIDIKCVRNVRDPATPGFTLEFYFEPNQYFSNGLLTKEYIIRYGSKNCDPFNCFGPEMVDCNGCEIYWKTHDLTVTIANHRLIKRPSFFNFFDPPKSEDPNIKPYVLNYLLTDFQIGYFLKEKIIPNATLYYLGEAVLRDQFGFEANDLEARKMCEIEDWPTSNKRKAALREKRRTLKLTPEQQQKWDQSENLLAERLKKKINKSELFEQSKVMLDVAATKAENLTDKVKLQQLELIKRKVRGHEINTIVAKDPIKSRAGITSYASYKKDNKDIIEPMVVKSFPQNERLAQMLREELINALNKEKLKIPKTVKSKAKSRTKQTNKSGIKVEK